MMLDRFGSVQVSWADTSLLCMGIRTNGFPEVGVVKSGRGLKGKVTKDLQQ